MTALILMLIWLSQIFPVMSDPPRPLNVRLTSSYFRHMLQWEEGVGTVPGVYYKVTFSTHKGTPWEPVVGCERVQYPLVCNLTVALSNPQMSYYAKVEAVLDKHSTAAFTEAFHPIRDTILDPPLLTVALSGPDVCLNLDPSMGHLRAIYDSFEYQLKIQSTDVDIPQFWKIKSLKKEVVKDLLPGREYCVSIRFLDNHVPRTSNFSQPKCIFIPGHFNPDLLISAGLCLFVITILVIVALLYAAGCVFLKKRPLPLVLASIRHTDDFVAVSCPLSLSSILNAKPTAPSLGEKKSNQTESSNSEEEEEEEEEENVTDITGGGRGGYKLKAFTNFLSTSSSCSSSSSSSAPLSPKSFLTNQNSTSVPPDVFIAMPEAPIAANSPSTSTAGGLTTEKTEIEEEEDMKEGDSQDVNLLTLTFGNHKDEKEEEPELVDLRSPPPVSEETSVLLSDMCHVNEAANDPNTCSDDEKETDEYDGGYVYRCRLQIPALNPQHL